MKRLWIRAHALPEVADIANRMMFGKSAQATMTLRYDTDDGNAMVVLEVPTEVADKVSRSAFLHTCGKILAEGEDPPYVGSDPPLTEEELRVEFAK